MDTHVTTIRLDDCRNGSYPACLDDAVSILLSQRENFIPAGLDGMAINVAEAQIRSAENSGDVIQAEILRREFVRGIEEYKTQIGAMIRGLYRFGHSGYTTAYMHSLDDAKGAVVIPEMRNFQFEIFPYTFDWGFTGRVLTDGKDDFHERLNVECSIYDAYDLATYMNPKSVFARMQDGTFKLLRKGHDDACETIDWTIDEHVFLGLDGRSDRFNVLEPGLQVRHSDEWKRITSNYSDRPLMIFGYDGNLLELSRDLSDSPYLYWRIGLVKNSTGDPNTPLRSCGHFGSERKWPEQRKRFTLSVNHADVYFDDFSLHFSHEAAYNSLMSLGDMVADIWIDPMLSHSEEMHDRIDVFLRKHGEEATGDLETDLQRFYELGPTQEDAQGQIPKWDIIYDRRAGITPQNPVKVRSDETALQYAVDR